MNKRFQHIIADHAEDFFSMTDSSHLTDDLAAHYRTMLYFVDYVDYKNGNGYHTGIDMRNALSVLGFAMPSFACICPQKTREMGFYLHLVTKNLENQNLHTLYDQYNAPGTSLVDRGLNAAFYRMVTGLNTHDSDLRLCAHEIFEQILQNEESDQKIAALETITGKYHVVNNLKALLVLELHDVAFGLHYSTVKTRVLDTIENRFKDSDSDLYRDYIQTGCLGFPGEILTESEQWHTMGLDPGINSLVIFFLNHFDHEKAGNAWNQFKEKFGSSLLTMEASQIASEENSYLSALSREAEGYIFSLLAAKEMKDSLFFNQLLQHLNQISMPRLSEGKIWFDSLGNKQDIIGFYIQLAKVHVGWDKLLSHPWQQYYHYDHHTN